MGPKWAANLLRDVLVNESVVANGDVDRATAGITSMEQETGDIDQHLAQSYHHPLNIVCVWERNRKRKGEG